MTRSDPRPENGRETLRFFGPDSLRVRTAPYEKIPRRQLPSGNLFAEQAAPFLGQSFLEVPVDMGRVSLEDGSITTLQQFIRGREQQQDKLIAPLDGGRATQGRGEGSLASGKADPIPTTGPACSLIIF